MALSNIANWNEDKTAASCGTACGASEKPAGSNRPGDDCSEPTGAERRQPAACGTACGASEAPAEEQKAACGASCGASDK